MKRQASEEYLVKRHIGCVASAHYGHAIYADDEHYESGPWHDGLYPEDMLGRTLPEGTRVRVTVEVLDETDAPLEENPWHLKNPKRHAEWCKACAAHIEGR